MFYLRIPVVAYFEISNVFINIFDRSGGFSFVNFITIVSRDAT